MPDIPEILESLRRVPAILRGLVRALPPARLHERRSPDFWTIAEHAAHLAEVQPMLLERVQRMLREERPVFTPFFPDKEDAPGRASIDVEAVLDDFLQRRLELLALLDKAGPDAWLRRAEHPEYERYGLHILARHILMHDHWHMYRMEELGLTRDEFLTRPGA